MVVDFELAAQIITNHFHGNGYNYITVSKSDIDWQDYIDEWDEIAPTDFTNSFGTRFFNTLANDESASERFLYHYQKPSVARLILEKKHIRASHLPAHSDNDREEYYYFMKQIGHPLVTGEKISQKVLSKLGGIQGIDDMRREVYISCFTNSENHNLFWERYAQQYRGVCFKFRYVPIKQNIVHNSMFPLYHLRKMIYDRSSNDRFIFYREMNEELINKVGHKVMVEPAPRFAVFYKRHSYAWEDEVRLSIDIGYLTARNSYPGIITRYNEGTIQYIQIPIVSADESLEYYRLPFVLILEEVIFGKNIFSEDKLEIERLVMHHFPNATFRYKK